MVVVVDVAIDGKEANMVEYLLRKRTRGDILTLCAGTLDLRVGAIFKVWDVA